MFPILYIFQLFVYCKFVREKNNVCTSPCSYPKGYWILVICNSSHDIFINIQTILKDNCDFDLTKFRKSNMIQESSQSESMERISCSIPDLLKLHKEVYFNSEFQEQNSISLSFHNRPLPPIPQISKWFYIFSILFIIILQINFMCLNRMNKNLYWLLKLLYNKL